MIKGYQYQSELAKKHYGQGYAEGRLEGLREGLALSVVRLLGMRGMALSDAERERILAEKDLDQLKKWLNQAIVAASLGDVLDGAS